MIIFPKAKINIGLRITGKRNDGYHDIETIFYPVNLYDALEFVASQGKDDTLTVTGLDPGGLPGDNLVMKAVKLLRREFSFPVLRIHLHKAIPSGAGLGGGSSDAAFMINAINRHFNLDIPSGRMMTLALELGSDCPFFLECIPALARGRGEVLEPLEPFLEGCYLVLVNPAIHISTSEAYRNCRPGKSLENLRKLITLPVNEWKDSIRNDFEEYAFGKFPVIGEIKNALYESGAVFSSMSGSGSTVYALFRDKTKLPEELGKLMIYEGKI